MLVYGDGNVIFEGSARGFEIVYKGAIKITESPDNLFISGNKKKIVGVMMADEDIPNKLFSYEGNFRILLCNMIQNNEMVKTEVKLQGVDFWQLDGQKWEDDGTKWGTSNKTFLVGAVQRFNKHDIVVNNNIRTQYDGQYNYSNGDPVLANTLIHIHNDGKAMTGGTHNEDSVEIYASKVDPARIQRVIKRSRQTTANYTTPAPTSTSGGSGGSGGGGGY
tara:strand:- start:2109 stop:2768 length:660 start_codon:yes stop_codon:yes gene_type:complete